MNYEINLEEIQTEEYITNPKALTEEINFLLIKNNTNQATEVITQTLQKQTKFYTTQFDKNNEIYYYEEGIYKPEGATIIKQYCRQILGPVYTEQFANKVIKKIEADTYIAQEKLLKRNYTEEIVVKNGILNLKTKELTEWTPEKIFFTKIPVQYDPEMKCEKIEEFFNSTLPEENDKKTIYELFGYSLIGGYPIQKIALFIGEGGNGKGQTLVLLREFLGEGNYSGIPLQKLENSDFKESELFGKLANIGADISDAPLKTTAKIKGLSGGDSMNASRKFKQDITFENEAKLIFSANKLPKTYDLTRAFFRRWIYIVFPYKFMSQQEINNLSENEKHNVKLKKDEIAKQILTEQELSGLLNKSLEGLNNLLTNGDFTSSQTSQETMKWWIDHSDSLLGFCYEAIEEDADSTLHKDLFRKAYQKYCRKNKIPAEGDRHIKETLTRTFHAWDYQESEGERVWGGIKLKESFMPF